MLLVSKLTRIGTTNYVSPWDPGALSWYKYTQCHTVDATRDGLSKCTKSLILACKWGDTVPMTPMNHYLEQNAWKNGSLFRTECMKKWITFWSQALFTLFVKPHLWVGNDPWKSPEAKYNLEQGKLIPHLKVLHLINTHLWVRASLCQNKIYIYRNNFLSFFGLWAKKDQEVWGSRAYRLDLHRLDLHKIYI